MQNSIEIMFQQSGDAEPTAAIAAKLRLCGEELSGPCQIVRREGVYSDYEGLLAEYDDGMRKIAAEHGVTDAATLARLARHWVWESACIQAEEEGGNAVAIATDMLNPLEITEAKPSPENE